MLSIAAAMALPLGIAATIDPADALRAE